MNNAQFTFDVLVNNRPVAEYPFNNETFIEGRQGSEYKLRLTNNSSSRVLAIMSVDGLSVMNGELASESDGGYIVSPFESILVPGWRIGNDSVAKFVFSSKELAYAAQMGKGSNLGVIGCLVIREKKPDTVYKPRPHFTTRGGETKGLSFSNEPTLGTHLLSESVIGTGYGDELNHSVREVTFERGDKVATFVIRYDTADRLMVRGIKINKTHNDVVLAANPFPGTGCPPPSGWTRKG